MIPNFFQVRLFHCWIPEDDAIKKFLEGIAYNKASEKV